MIGSHVGQKSATHKPHRAHQPLTQFGNFHTLSSKEIAVRVLPERRFVKIQLLGLKILVDLLYKLVGIGSVNGASVSDGLTAGSGTAEAVHTDLKEKACRFYIEIENITNNGFLRYLHNTSSLIWIYGYIIYHFF